MADCLRSASICDEIGSWSIHFPPTAPSRLRAASGRGCFSGVSGLYQAKAVRAGAGHRRLGPEPGRGRATHPWIAPGNRRRYRLARNPADGYEIRRILYHLGHYYARGIYPDRPSAPVPASRGRDLAVSSRMPRLSSTERCERLSAPMLHFSYEDIADHVATMNRLDHPVGGASAQPDADPASDVHQSGLALFQFLRAARRLPGGNQRIVRGDGGRVLRLSQVCENV